MTTKKINWKEYYSPYSDTKLKQVIKNYEYEIERSNEAIKAINEILEDRKK